MGVIKNILLKKYLYKIEARIYNKAKGIISLSPPITNYILSKSKNKIITIPNFSDRTVFTPQYSEPKPLVIAYIGAIGKANHLEYLVDAANATQELDVKYIIMGEGGELPNIKKRAKGILNLEFKNFADQKSVIKVLNQAHAVYISYKDIEILETGSPNKFFDALAAGKLIIVNFKGWLKDMIEQYQCGFYTNPNSPDDLKAQLEPFLDSKKLPIAQENSRKLSEKFDKTNSVQRIETFIKSL